MKQKHIQIVVLGAGYAGMMAALRLSGKTRRLGVAILLINGENTFIQRPRLHQVATGQEVPQTPIHQMLRGTRVQFLQAWVSSVHPNEHIVSVKTAEGTQEIPYDYLVYALGSVVDQNSSGVREYAHVLDPRGSNAAGALLERLQVLSQTGGQVVVVGGGATGIEGATEIKGQFPNLHVSLVTDGRFGTFKGARLQRHFREAFRQQDIPIYEECKVQVVEAGQLLLAAGERNTFGEKIPFDICVWAGGFRASPLAREAGFNVNERGQILVDPFGRSLSHPEVYAIGDTSHPVEEPGVPLRMSLQTALTRGAHAADNITAQLRGKPQTPLSFAYYGQGIALGPNDAVGFLTYPADVLIGPVLRGKAAVYMRNFFVWMIFYFLKLEQWMPGFFFWIGKGRYAKAKRSQQARTSNMAGTV